MHTEQPTTITRKTRGYDLYMAHHVKQDGSFWKVPSATSRAKVYRVDLTRQQCDCADYLIRKSKCKHIYAVEFTLENAVEALPVRQTWRKPKRAR